MTDYFIGIDIGKDYFDAVLITASQIVGPCRHFSNTQGGFAAFQKAYKNNLPHALVILEATGGYELALMNRLLEQDVSLHRVAPLQAKHYLRSRRLYAKTDNLDACGLAYYGLERGDSLRCETLASAHETLLKQYSTRREDLVTMRAAEKQRLQHPNYSHTKASVQKLIDCLTEQIEDLDKKIAAVIDTDPRSQAVFNTLTAIKGVGSVTAMTLIATLPEIGYANRKQIASLAGCAPHPKDSGKQNTYRATRGGRAVVKRALFMAAMSARQHNPDLKQFNDRLIQNGKKPIVALTATMRKLVTIMNAKVRDEVCSQSW